MRILLGGIGYREEVRPGTVESSSLTNRDWTRINGMQDLLLAMDDRVRTIKATVRAGAEATTIQMLEKA